MKKGILILLAATFVVSVSAQNRTRYNENKNENYKEELTKRSLRGQRNSTYNKQNSSRRINDLDRLDRFSDRDRIAYNKKKYKNNKSNKNNHGKGNNSNKYYLKHSKKYHVNYSKKHSHGVVACHDYNKRVTYLPGNHVRIKFNGITLFFTDGVFYKNHRGYYEQVTPPVGAVVHQLPIYAERVSIEGRIYYEFRNTLFKKIETNRGYAYEVVGQLNWN